MRRVTLCAPSRVYEDHPRGRFSCTSMVDYFADMGIGAIDMSVESLSRLDEAWQSVLYSAATRAKGKNISIPVCHLSFYMPDPFNDALMQEYSRELKKGIDAARIMGIPLAVAHPIALYSSEHSYGDWVRANMKFLQPIVEYARERGVKICVENMPSDKQKEAAGNHLYGSCALNIAALAQKLNCGICFDVGHANVSGYKMSEQLEILRGKLDVLHIHDNHGVRDEHLLPFDGSVDWQDVADGIKKADFGGILDVEVTAWALPGDKATRDAFGGKIVARAKRLMKLADLI